MTAFSHATGRGLLALIPLIAALDCAAEQGYAVKFQAGQFPCSFPISDAPNLDACNTALDAHNQPSCTGVAGFDWQRCMVSSYPVVSWCGWGSYSTNPPANCPAGNASWFIICDDDDPNDKSTWTNYSGSPALDCPNDEVRKDPPATPGLCEGNPCNPATGTKYQVEIDYQSPWIRFARHYSSAARKTQFERVGRNWRHSFQKRIVIGSAAIAVERETGQES